MQKDTGDIFSFLMKMWHFAMFPVNSKVFDLFIFCSLCLIQFVAVEQAVELAALLIFLKKTKTGVDDLHLLTFLLSNWNIHLFFYIILNKQK